MKFSFLKICFFAVLFSFFLPFSVNAGAEGLVPNDYLDIGEPHGIAIDSNGNQYVVDKLNDRVKIFSSSGEYISSFGNTEEGVFDQDVYDITLDNNGYLYVSTRCHIYKFSYLGSFISRWGTCDDAVPLGELRAIHYDASQNRIMVSEADRHKVQVFTKNGTFIGSFGSLGSGNGQFDEPYGITTDSDGNIYVVDSNNHRVQKFDKDFTYITSFGARIENGGKFEFPKDIVLTSAGNFLITSQNSYKIVMYDSNLNFVSEFGTEGGGEGEFHAPRYMVVDEDGYIHVTDWMNKSIQTFESDGDFVSGIANSGKSEGRFYNPTAMAKDSIGNIYVLDDGAGTPRVQKFDGNGDFISTVISGGENPLFNSSYYLVINNDLLYISGDSGVKVYNTAGEYIRTIGTSGTSEGQFQQARGMDFDANGYIYIADFYNHVVHVYDNNEGETLGDYIAAIGSEGTGNGQFKNTNAVLVDDTNGFVYVSDSGDGLVRIQKFNISDQSWAETIVSSVDYSDYGEIQDMRMDSSGNIYVVDSNKNKIDSYLYDDIEESFSFGDTYGTEGSDLDELRGPRGLFIDDSNFVYIVDTENHRIFIKPTGTRITNLSPELDIFKTIEGDLYESVVNEYVTDPEAASALEGMLFLRGVPIASFVFDLSTNQNWSNVVAAVIPEKSKVFVENLNSGSAPGISEESIRVYVPKYEGQDQVLVCPNANSLLDINLGCEDSYEVDLENVGTVDVVTFGEYEYWILTGIQGGLMSYSTTRLDITAEAGPVYVDQPLTITITPIAEGDALDTNYLGRVEVVSTPYEGDIHFVETVMQPVAPITKQITFTEEGTYSLRIEDIDDPYLYDTLEDIAVLGIQDEEEEEEEDNNNNNEKKSNNIYATRELTCTEDPAQDKCMVPSYISDIVFTKLDNTSAKICWNQTIESESYLQLTEEGEPVGEKFIGETTDGTLYCATIFGLTNDMDYGYIIVIDEVKDDENVSGRYEGIFSMKESTTTDVTDNVEDDSDEEKSGSNLLKTILIIIGIAVAAFILFFIIFKKREEDEDTNNTER